MRLSRLFLLALLCSQMLWAAKAPSFVTISDIHYGRNNSSKPGSDAGIDLLNSSMAKLKELSKNVDFILVLGDLPTHMHSSGLKYKGSYEQEVFEKLYQADSAHKPMFYVTGNNDSLKGNYQPFSYKGISPLTYAKKWNNACAYCKGLMIDASHMRSGGYYASYVIPGNKDIILIALNTVQWTRSTNIFSPYPNQEKDALEQLIWLESTMKKHHGKQLIIAMHIPPGVSYIGFNFWYPSYLKAFMDILSANHAGYKEVTLLTSHTHREEFRAINVGGGKKIYAYSTPSISRTYYNNPAIKVFSLNEDMKFANFTTYYSVNNKKWTSDRYTALGNKDSLFPGCAAKTLATCLDAIGANEVCLSMQKGQFYGVKNQEVPSPVQDCKGIFAVSL